MPSPTPLTPQHLNVLLGVIRRSRPLFKDEQAYNQFIDHCIGEMNPMNTSLHPIEFARSAKSARR